jgi:repressor LexA
MLTYFPEKKSLTPRQEKVLAYLVDFVKKKGYPPSLREIAHYFQLRGPRAIKKHLDLLEQKGYIRRSPRRSRAIEILDLNLLQIQWVPLVGRIKAGAPVLTWENIQGYAAFDFSLFPEGVFLLQVEGESMREAHILPGDYVVVKPQSAAENGDIVIALREGEATVKRFFQRPGETILQPENSAMEPIVIKEGEDLRIIGKVVGTIRKY